MPREDYVAEEKRKVREVAVGIGVPSAEVMGIDLEQFLSRVPGLEAEEW